MELAEEVAKLREEIKRLSERLETALSSEGNPVSLKCIEVLKKPPKCYDFSGTRRYAACKAWETMETEKVGWKEGITKGWEEVKKTCVWD